MSMQMDVLLYNSKGKVVSAYTPNDKDFKSGDVVVIDGKDCKVVDLEKYRLMSAGEFVALGLK